MKRATIFVFFGLIASGKSTLAERFAADHNCSGYNTDRVRKELAGLEATQPRPDGMEQGIYSREYTEKTYQEMLARAEQDLIKGRGCVVLDGSYSREVDRKKVLELAEALAVDAIFILCSCSDTEVRRRLALRAKDPNAVSDGRWEIFVHQKEHFAYPAEQAEERILRLNTEEEPELLLTRIEDFLGSRP